MRRSRVVSLAALCTAAALALAGCAGGGGSGQGTGSGSGSTPPGGGTFSVQVDNPENPLVPGNTTESEGNQILKALFTPLVGYTLEETKLEYTGVAESIESTDSTTWTVKLKPGWTFHDGTKVTANSFVKSWNYTANAANAQGGASFFSKIEGFSGDAPVEAMSGLVVVDDTTFTVKLTAPFAQFPLMTGYMAFAPLPDSFYGNVEAFGKKPIGNGPFKADTELVPDQGMSLSRFDAFGGDKAIAEKFDFKVFSDNNTAYNEMLAGNLDIVRPRIPPELIATAKQELGDRFIERESAGFTYMGFPTYDPRYADKRVRQGISMAIDRKAITDTIFSGARQPAMDVIPPVMDGARPDACKYCAYDAVRAKALLTEAGFDFTKPVELWFNAGASHDAWVQAVGNQLKQNLGVDYVLKGDLDFAQYLPKQDEKGMTGPFRLGWGMDYPSPQNFLEPLFGGKSLPPGSNTTFWVNADFDKLVSEGNAASSNEEAVAKYQAADDVLLEEMPMAPMFFNAVQGARSTKVTDVAFDAYEDVVLAKVKPVTG